MMTFQARSTSCCFSSHSCFVDLSPILGCVSTLCNVHGTRRSNRTHDLEAFLGKSTPELFSDRGPRQADLDNETQCVVKRWALRRKLASSGSILVGSYAKNGPWILTKAGANCTRRCDGADAGPPRRLGASEQQWVDGRKAL